MEQLKAIYKAIVNAAAHVIGKLVRFVEPMLHAPRDAKNAGKKPSFKDYLKCALGFMTFLVGWSIVVAVMIIVGRILTIALSVIFAAWLAELIATIIVISFEFSLIGAIFDNKVTA